MGLLMQILKLLRLVPLWLFKILRNTVPFLKQAIYSFTQALSISAFHFPVCIAKLSNCDQTDFANLGENHAIS